jgi:RNA polymerase sigma factor (TIGR02999 family)
MDDTHAITALLAALQEGKREAVDALTPLLHNELRRIAARHLRRERQGHTLEPTALIHEAYMRLVQQEEVTWQNRAHFLAVAAQVMRRILTDHARSRARVKRGGLAARVTLDEAKVSGQERDMNLVALDDALTALEDQDPELARIVELRFFAGMTVEEAADVLGLSPRTVHRAWATARTWLRREMQRQGV